MVDNFFAETEQVAFCTQNVPPGIDFSNDPLLQGRNFSYLDTQIKRLGGPNFTHIPINAPRCPFAHFQQDGHMAMRNPKGRANYEPNSWGADGGPRENPKIGFRSFPDTEEGTKVRLRPESFSDHYSQARLFFISQTPIEQKHLCDALVFELSKVERPDIRERMVCPPVQHSRRVGGDGGERPGHRAPGACGGGAGRRVTTCRPPQRLASSSEGLSGSRGASSASSRPMVQTRLFSPHSRRLSQKPAVCSRSSHPRSPA